MAWFADLAECGYFGPEYESFLRAVGWLEKGQPFATGELNHDVYRRLVELAKDPWQPMQSCGLHRCDLCLYEGPTGVKNLFIPAGDHLLVCPELITHYMNAHGYQPPTEFCSAVLNCPAMRSTAYLKALVGSGAKALLA